MRNDYIARRRTRTLVVVVLVRVIPIQAVQYLDHVGIGIGPAKGVASSIEAQDQLLGLLNLFRAVAGAVPTSYAIRALSGRHVSDRIC
jgi:hypothetical protein